MKVQDYNTLNTQKIRSIGGKQAISMDFGEAAKGMLFTMFTEQIYKNPIGSICREITSNCFDSHVEAGKESPSNPVIIKKTYDNTTKSHYISFFDNGVGMSPERVDSVFSKYFESTKRTTNDEIGGFGIGGKTPLAYKRKWTDENGHVQEDSSFFIITRYNGIEYKYLIYIGDSSPKIKPMGEESTTKCNGTEVRIPVLQKDLDKFEYELYRQLYYFENIVFQGFSDDSRLNEYRVYKGKHFLYRGDNYESTTHVCLGKVAYPLSYSDLGLSEWDYKIPIGLTFQIGDIKVTPNREDLQYNDDTIKLIKEKLELAKQEIKDIISKQYDNVRTLEDYYAVKENFGYIQFADQQQLNVNRWVSKAAINFTNFKYNDLPHIPTSDELVKHFYHIHEYGKRKGYGNIGVCCFTKTDDRVYQCRGEFQRKIIKQSYLNHNHDKNFVILKPYMQDVFADDTRWEKIRLAFGVSKDEGSWSHTNIVDKMDLNVAKKLLKALRKDVVAWVQKNYTSYDELEVPQDFIDSRKKDRLSKDILKTTIPVKDARRWGSHERVSIESIVNFKGRIYWGVTDEDYLVRRGHEYFLNLFGDKHIDRPYGYHNRFANGKGILFLVVSKANAKYMRMSKNAYHINTIYPTMLCRKMINPADIKIANDFIYKYKNLSEMYRNDTFDVVNKVVHKYHKEVKNEVKSLEKYDGFKYVDFNDELISKYYDVNQPSTLKIKTERKLNYLLDVQDKNNETTKWVNISYYAKSENLNNQKYSGLVEVLKKVMVF